MILGQTELISLGWRDAFMKAPGFLSALSGLYASGNLPWSFTLHRKWSELLEQIRLHFELQSSSWKFSSAARRTEKRSSAIELNTSICKFLEKWDSTASQIKDRSRPFRFLRRSPLEREIRGNGDLPRVLNPIDGMRDHEGSRLPTFLHSGYLDSSHHAFAHILMFF